MSHKQRLLKMFSAISVMVLATLTIVACGSSGMAGQLNNGKITICHATGSATDPYAEITIDFNELNGHSTHTDNLVPAPVGGCPKEVKTDSNDGKITICHATGSANNPFNEITIDSMDCADIATTRAILSRLPKMAAHQLRQFLR